MASGSAADREVAAPRPVKPEAPWTGFRWDKRPSRLHAAWTIEVRHGCPRVVAPKACVKVNIGDIAPGHSALNWQELLRLCPCVHAGVDSAANPFLVLFIFLCFAPNESMPYMG